MNLGRALGIAAPIVFVATGVVAGGFVDGESDLTNATVAAEEPGLASPATIGAVVGAFALALLIVAVVRWADR